MWPSSSVSSGSVLKERPQRLVIGGGAHLDHAARGQLQRAVGLQLVHAAQGAVFGDETLERRLPGKVGPGSLHVQLEGAAVLQFLVLPLCLQPGGHLGVVGVVRRQVAGVQVGAGFDERCADQQVEQLFMTSDAALVDARPVHLVHAPARGVAGGGRGVGGGVALQRRGFAGPRSGVERRTVQGIEIRRQR